MPRVRGVIKPTAPPKKTSIGKGPNRKYGNKGGGEKGSTTSKNYTKRYRGQGR